MGTVAKDTGGGKSYQPAPAGSHRAVCISVIDLGMQTKTWEGKTTQRQEILLTWELVDEMMEDGRPFTLSRTFTLSLHERAGLRKFLDNWRGRPFTEAELAGWDVKNLLGQPCLLSVTHATKGDRTYANVGSANRLPKGMNPPKETENDLLYINLDDRHIPPNVPRWIAEKIRASEEYQAGDFRDEGPTDEDDRPGDKAKEYAGVNAGAKAGGEGNDEDIPF